MILFESYDHMLNFVNSLGMGEVKGPVIDLRNWEATGISFVFGVAFGFEIIQQHGWVGETSLF